MNKLQDVDGRGPGEMGGGKGGVAWGGGVRDIVGGVVLGREEG